MVKLISRYALFAVVLTTACGTLSANDKTAAPAQAASATEQQDFYQLFSLFVKAPTQEMSFPADDGLQYDELKAFKVLDELYAKHKEPDMADKSYSRNRLRVIAFFSHLAEQHNNAALSEYLASDLVPIFETNPGRFLSVLGELPFLTPSNCERLNSYFGFEGKHANEKSNFIKTNAPLIKKALGQSLAESCLSKF